MLLNWDDEEDNQVPAAGAEDEDDVDVMPALDNDDNDDENT